MAPQSRSVQRIGPPEAAPNAVGWPDIAIALNYMPGRLVLFASYFRHWTVPLEKPALRISIAVDVVNLRIAADGDQVPVSHGIAFS